MLSHKGEARLWRLLLIIGLCLFLSVAAATAQSLPVSTHTIVVVGGDRDYPPYEFIDKNGQPNGYNVELTRAIAEVMGMKVEIRLGAWSEMRKALQNGNIAVLQGMSYSEERVGEVGGGAS